MSEVRGIAKTPVAEIELDAESGIRGDSHAGAGHRQVSLLADESADLMRAKGADVGPGAFGENILTRGLDLKSLPIGTRLHIDGGVLLKVTQIGKECHTPCAIYAAAGECIMPTEGIFTRVLQGGRVRPGAGIEVLADAPALFRAAVLVLSDSRAAGQREDQVIPAVTERLAATPCELVAAGIVPDDLEGIVAALRDLVAQGDIHLILTSGGTGLAPRDNTPEATRSVIEREAPGIADLLRLRGLTHTPRAALTRGIAGTAGRTLIVNLPGSPRGVREGIDTLLPILPHALETLLGQTGECARP